MQTLLHSQARYYSVSDSKCICDCKSTELYGFERRPGRLGQVFIFCSRSKFTTQTIAAGVIFMGLACLRLGTSRSLVDSLWSDPRERVTLNLQVGCHNACARNDSKHLSNYKRHLALKQIIGGCYVAGN